jgi:hypothetical protein
MPALGRHGGGHAAVLIEHDGQLFFADPSIYHDEPLLVRGASWQFVSSRGEAYPIVTDARGEKHSSVLSITPTGEGSFKAEMSIFDGDNYHLRFYHKYDIENTMEEFPDIGDVPALYLADPALMLKYLVGEEVRIVLMSFGEDGEKVLQFKDLSDAGGYTTVRKGDEGYAYDARLSRVASESGIGALDIENMLGHVRTCVTALRNRV